MCANCVQDEGIFGAVFFCCARCSALCVDMWYVVIVGLLDLIVEVLGKAVRGVGWPLECREAVRWFYDWRWV